MTTTLAAAAVIALAFASWAIWRWRVRVYVDAREIPPPISGARELNREGQTFGTLYEPCLSCGRPKLPDTVCHACGFCGIVTVEDSPNPRSRLVQGSPAGANEAKDSSRRRWG
jgi:hypothetical protein